MEEGKVNPRKRNCEICEEIESKYKCPGCSMQTCSLPCVKEHKKLKNCDGKRCVTSYVKISNFSENNLLSDYRFLEDLSRCSSNASRDKTNRLKSPNVHRLNLARHAKARHINLHLLAIGMTKQRENTSIFHYKEKCLFWRIKFLFVNEDAEFVLPRVQETDILSDIIKLYVEPEEDDFLVKYKLKSYIDCGIARVNVFMKSERSKTPGYHKLDLSKSLADNLKYKTVIEYPTFCVAIDGKDEKFQSKGEVKLLE